MASSSVISSSGGMQLLLLFFLFISTCFLLPSSLDAQETTRTSVPVGSPLPPFSFSFNFSDPSNDPTMDLKFEGDASSVSSNHADLTCNSFEQGQLTGCLGRMSYNHPVPFYDDTTLASFNTSFTFVIQVDDQADTSQVFQGGMAFFLSSYPSSMPPNSGGNNLGLLSSNVDAASGTGQFVTVEFDLFQDENLTDPTDNQLRIDINTLQSDPYKTNFSLPRLSTGTMTATIQFNNLTGMLVASLRFHEYPNMEPVVLSRMLPDPRSLLPQEVAVGFSAASSTSTEHQIFAWSFNSTLATPTPHKGHDNWKARIIVGGALALVLLLLVAWVIISCWKWTNRHGGVEMLGKQEPTQFEYRDLEVATEHFSEQRKLGEGFFGVVYSGYLKKLGCEVAVKKLRCGFPNKSHVTQGPNNRDFYAELNTITSVKHKNLVKLVGWCRGNRWNFVDFMCWCWKNQTNKLFLVYELVPKGSLHEHLHKEETLPWIKRYKIVKDIACALFYLHHECDPFILHRDIKPSNILLDDNFNAKLADFGLSRIVDDDSSKILTIPVGTERYLDPECKKQVGMVEFSRSSDVYSFGMVLLEIACNKVGIAREQVWQHYIKRSVLQAADDKLKGEFDKSEMESVIILGLWCSYLDSKKRPSMEQVRAVLENGRSLPDLNSLDTTSVSTQHDTYIDPQACSSAGSSSYEQRA